MPAEVVVLLTVPINSAKLSGGPRTHLPVVKTRLLREGPGLPALHPSRRDRGPVDAATLDRHVSADALKALAPEHLTRAGNVFDIGEPVVVVPAAFDKRRSGDAERRVLRELLYQELEVVGLERDVGIEASDDIEVDVIQLVEAGIETMDFRGEAAVTFLRHTDQPNPVAALLIADDDFVGPVGGTVADNHPSLWWVCLRDHRLENEADVLLLVSGRRDEDITESHSVRQRP